MKKMILFLPVLAGVMFGAAGVFVRRLTAYGMDNLTILFSRSVFAALALFFFLLLFDRKRLPIRLRDLPIFMGTGLVGMLCLTLCYNESLNRLPLSLAAVLLSTAPIFVMFFAAFLFREKVTGKNVACMLLAILGCALASGLFEQHTGFDISTVGIVAGIAAAFFYAMYSIFSRMATDRGYHTYTVIFYSVLLITVGLSPFADYGILGRFIAEAPVSNLLFLLAQSLCASALPYVFLTLALLYADSGKVFILASGGEPIAAVVFGLIFYREMPTPLMFLGLAVTIGALLLLCKKPREPEEAGEPGKNDGI